MAVGSACQLAAAGAGDDGTDIAQRWAAGPDDPWAVCHGVRAMGRNFKLQDGRQAVDWLLETQLVSVVANGTSVLSFPVSVEAHPNMFLKTLLEAGVPLDHRFKHRAEVRTVGEVVQGAHALFRPAQVLSQPNMLPWSLIAFARTTSPARPRWTNAWGESVDFPLVVESALRLMETASLPLTKAMREERSESVRAPVHEFTCGGAHMLYALLSTAETGHAGAEQVERILEQADVMLWRLRADLALIKRFYRERSAQPGAYWYALDAELKLLGHGEECLALGVRRGLVKLDNQKQRQRREAVATLRQRIADMQRRDMTEARALNRELFRQLVGDACHARHGLTLA